MSCDVDNTRKVYRHGTYPDQHGPTVGEVSIHSARSTGKRRTREGQRGAATRHEDGGRLATIQPEDPPSKGNPSKELAREDDLMTNASSEGCLPEQTTAYWDEALEPTRAAWRGWKWFWKVEN